MGSAIRASSDFSQPRPELCHLLVLVLRLIAPEACRVTQHLQGVLEAQVVLHVLPAEVPGGTCREGGFHHAEPGVESSPLGEVKFVARRTPSSVGMLSCTTSM